MSVFGRRAAALSRLDNGLGLPDSHRQIRDSRPPSLPVQEHGCTASPRVPAIGDVRDQRATHFLLGAAVRLALARRAETAEISWMRKRAGRTRCGIPHEGERGDVDADYCFAAIASKIAASTPAGTLSLSAQTRVVTDSGRMPEIWREQVLALPAAGCRLPGLGRHASRRSPSHSSMLIATPSACIRLVVERLVGVWRRAHSRCLGATWNVGSLL
jgi:hypothetical protein